MRRPRQGFGYAVIDMLSALSAVFLVLAVTPSDSPAKPPSPGMPVGLVTVQLTWDLKDDADVDLWVKSPDDTPVGFLRKNGRHFDLLRDDLGRSADADSRNLELAVARAAPAGEYVVNAMLYLDRDGQLPVHVKTEVRCMDGQELDAQGELTGDGDEITLLRFRVSPGGKISYENDLFMPLDNGSAS